MHTESKIVEIFCLVDDFYKNYESAIKGHLLQVRKGQRNKPSRMSASEVMTIMICFHLGGYRCFKHYYLNYIQKHMQKEFPVTVSYNRFVELMHQHTMPLAMFVKMSCMGDCSGISFIDSTAIRVCHNRRIRSNKVFKGKATTGKTSTGWFHGFKLHLVINDKGDLLNFVITQANVDDRNPGIVGTMCKKVFGKLFGDKGYLSKSLFEFLFNDGIQLFTKIRNNMKNQLMTMKDKILLRKRAVIESVNDELKNLCQVEHSRHRSFKNFFTNLLAGLAAYSFFDKKPSLHFQTVQSNQLAIFI